MSRHTIDGHAPEHTVVVGYDRPLNDFFGQVIDAEGEMVHWVMSTPHPAQLAAEMAPYATVSESLQQTLADEQRNRVSHPMMLAVDHRPSAQYG